RLRGFSPLALTCFVPDALTKIRQQGLDAEELAAHIPALALVAGPFRVLTTLLRSAWMKRRFVREQDLTYEGVSLGDLLWPAVHLFLLAELPARYVMARALTRFFKSNTPA